MQKITIAFLHRSSFISRSLLLSSRALATQVSKFSSASLQDAEVGAFSETVMGPSESRKAPERKKVPRLKAGKGGYSEKDLRGAEESLHTQISTAKAKRRAEAKTGAEGYVEDPTACFVAVRKAMQPKGVRIIEHENAAMERTEELASCASTSSVQKDLAEVFGKLGVDTYKYGNRWKQTACKLLEYGISLTHIISMLKKCRNLACSVVWVDSTLRHFALLGMSHEKMGRAILRLPTILNVTDSMFRHKIEFFESVGIERHYLSKSAHLAVLAVMTNLSTLRKNVTFWNDYMKDVRVNAVCCMMVANPRILAYKSFQQQVAWLEAHQFERKWYLKGSSVLCSTLPTLISKAEMLERLGIFDPKKRAWALVVLARFKNSKLQAQFDNLLAAGFSLHQAQGIVAKAPAVLSLTKQNVDATMHYALNVMNVSLHTLALNTRVWCHKLETRVKNRHDVLKRLQSLGALKKEMSLDNMVRMKESDFNRRFVEKLLDIEKKGKHA